MRDGFRHQPPSVLSQISAQRTKSEYGVATTTLFLYRISHGDDYRI